jgi:shikimate dehydrogenase
VKFGLIGKKLGYSWSKQIHGELTDYQYDMIELGEDEFDNFIEHNDYSGFNITIPYKKQIIPHCSTLSPIAEKIGSVNTVYYDSEGKLHGFNTDYYGFIYACRRAGIKLNGLDVLVLGSGGTSDTVKVALSDMGAKSITVISRSKTPQSETMGNLTSEISSTIPQGESPRITNNREKHETWQPPIHRYTYDDLKNINDVDVIINTTPVGTYPNNDESVIHSADFPDCRAVFDVIYNPMKTKLILEAEAKTLAYSNGFPMLVAQAKYASMLFNMLETTTEYEAYVIDFIGDNDSSNYKEDADIERVLKEISDDLTNIVLIGMPGSGKSTLGKMISKKFNKPFVDIDNEIVKSERTGIPSIFENHGENYFRNLETETIKKVAKESRQVISVGGGAVLRPENVDALKQNGLIIWIKRDIESLSIKGRPLSKDINALHEIYAKRKDLYEKYSDLEITNNGKVGHAVGELCEKIGKR